MVTFLLLGPHCAPLHNQLGNVQTYWTSEPIDLRQVNAVRPDAIVSFGYRFKISQHILESVSHLALNCHISLLPWNKGADPNFWSWVDDTPKGVTVHWMTEDIDQGEIVTSASVDFSASDTLATSYEVLMSTATALLTKLLNSGPIDQLPRTPQQLGGSYHRASERLKVWHLFPDEWNTPCIDVRKIFHGEGEFGL